MKLRGLLTFAVTTGIADLLYRSRDCTFIVWTNASMIDRVHPLLTVAAIEALVLSILAFVVWAALGELVRRFWPPASKRFQGKGPGSPKLAR